MSFKYITHEKRYRVMFSLIYFRHKTLGVSEIEKFYMNGCAYAGGHTLEYILNQSDDWLEQRHDYIQWLFPTDQLSRFNFKAPVISTKSADELVQKHGDKLKEKMLESFFRMAKFYGFHVFYNIDGSITIKSNDVIDKGWLSKGNHNFLRLTRIMQSLQLFGLHDYCMALKKYLLDIACEYPNIVGEKTRQYWSNC